MVLIEGSPSSSSVLGSKISNTGRILRDSAFSQINEYQQRFSKVTKLYELLFKDLLITNFNNKNAYMTAKKMFGKDIVTFVAIDGTEYSKRLFDMIIFYAGAYSCEGTIHFSNNEDILIRYKNCFLDKGKDLSSCVPVYIEKVPEIDQTFYDPAEGKANVMKSMSEETILNNTNIANYLMTFAEFYLAYKLAASAQYNVILLDRSLFVTRLQD